MSGTMALILLIVSANIFIVSVFGLHLNSGTDIVKQVDGIQQVNRVIQAKRGSILDRGGNVLAEDVIAYTLTANIDPERYTAKKEPAHVVDKEDAALTISRVIGKDYDSVQSILNSSAKQVEFGYEGKYLSANQKAELEASDIKGLGFIQVRNRISPRHDGQYSHVIGFARLDENQVLQGSMGIEKSYNDLLLGVNGVEKYQEDKAGNKLQHAELYEEPAVNGKNIKLTLDSTIQNQLELSLEGITKDPGVNADAAWGIVMEAKTGRILGLGEYPGFDPNSEDADYVSKTLNYSYEPGSTMKTFTVAAAIEEGVWDDNATYDSGEFYVGNKNGIPVRLSSPTGSIHTITNANNIDYGIQNFREGYAVSSNVMISELLTKYMTYDTFDKYMQKLGFYAGVEVDEGIKSIAGYPSTTYDTSALRYLNPGFGQGATVSVLEMAQAYTAIMTDGNLIKPYIVDSISDPDTGEVTYQGKTTVVHQVFSPSTAAHARDLMRDVVAGRVGSGRRFNIDEVEVIGKTGTAQLAVKGGGYSPTKYIFSSALGFPYDDPEIIVYTAYQANYGHNLNASAAHVNDVVRTTVSVMNISKFTGEVVTEIKADTLKDYKNMNVEKAKQDILSKGYDPIIIGDGDTVVNQYPQADSKIISHERVYITTNGPNITMPNMKGWSQKEVVTYWNQSGISIALNGSGYVVSQSIEAGTAINKDTEISVTLE